MESLQHFTLSSSTAISASAGLIPPVRNWEKPEENAKARRGENAKGTGTADDPAGSNSAVPIGLRVFALSRLRVLFGRVSFSRGGLRRVGVDEGAQELAELAAAALDAGLGGAQGTFQDRGDFFLGETVDIVEDDGRPERSRELLERGVNGGAEVGVGRGALRIAGRGRVLRLDTEVLQQAAVERQRFQVPFPLAIVINAQVDGDLVEPGIEAGVLAEPKQRRVGLEERLLGQVQSVLPGGDHAGDNRVDPVLVAADQLGVGARGAGLRFPDQIRVRVPLQRPDYPPDSFSPGHRLPSYPVRSSV